MPKYPIVEAIIAAQQELKKDAEYINICKELELAHDEQDAAMAKVEALAELKYQMLDRAVGKLLVNNV